MESRQYIEFKKLLAYTEQQQTRIDSLKCLYKELSANQNQMMKQLKRMESKLKNKTNREPYGFARPMLVTDELCAFLEKESGTLISRTEATKAIIKYIYDQKLQNPQNRRQILPDATLLKLFGEAAVGKVIDYFTMQKYVNHHFPKKISPDVATDVSMTDPIPVPTTLSDSVPSDSVPAVAE